MALEIKTSNIKPKRHTYANVAERLGEDRPASRYEEATYDLEPVANFHYRPTWDPQHELYDKRRTAIVMQDWYALLDPRQLYYATYTISRNKMMDAADAQIKFVEDRALLSQLTEKGREVTERIVLPVRHYEWGANMNNTEIARFGSGTAVTQAAGFAGMDRLGLAQLISRVGLVLDALGPVKCAAPVEMPEVAPVTPAPAEERRSGLARLFGGGKPDHPPTDKPVPTTPSAVQAKPASGSVLHATQACWTGDPVWQPLRHAMEDSFVLKDWFELFIAQNVVMDTLVHGLVFEHVDRALTNEGGAGVSMMTEMTRVWAKDHERWTQAVLKRTADESSGNAETLSAWTKQWGDRVLEALEPAAEVALGADARNAMDALRERLSARAKKAGLAV